MTNVVKKGGKKQSFNPTKLRNSVLKAAKDAKLAPAKTKQLLVEVAEPVIALAKKKSVVKTTALRKSLLGRLDRRAKLVSKAWRNFEKNKCKCVCCR